MIGKMFSVWIEIVPFSCIIFKVLFLLMIAVRVHQCLFQRAVG